MKKAAVGAVVLVVGMAAFRARAAVIYVDADASGANDGTSWTDAYTDLQSALTQPLVFGDEIWVAEGTYKPTATTNRGISFVLGINIPVYGGFAGTEVSRAERDWVANATILLGDINNTPGDPLDNTFNIVKGATGARLDGFTVTGARYSGMNNDSISGIVVANCTFAGNTSGTQGSGMWCVGCPNVTVTDCTFSGNTAETSGGAAHVRSCGSLAVTGCTFSANTAGGLGGGALVVEATPTTVSGCDFSANTTTLEWGGAVRVFGSSPIDFANCTFSSNSALAGGAIRSPSPTSIVNCVFLSNAATGAGAGLYINGFPSSVENCTFYGNNALGGGGAIYNAGDSTVTNCILWGNGVSEIATGGGTITVDYSNVQGGWGGAGANNIDSDPLFVDAAGDDVRLLAGSPCIDTGDPATTLTEDVDGNPRPLDSGYDMGAYEFSPIPTYTVSGNVTLTGALTGPVGVTIRLMSGGAEGDSMVLSSAAYSLDVPDGTYAAVLDLSSSPSLVFDVTSPEPNAIVVSGGAVAVDVSAVVVDLSTTYTITPSVDAGSGTITPDTPQTVFAGESETFVIAPDTGYEIADVLVDGGSVGAVDSYTFTDVAANHTIAVTFAAIPTTYTVSGTVTLTGALTDPSGVTIRLAGGGTEGDSEVLSGAAYSLDVPDGTYTVVLSLPSSPSLVFTVTSPEPNAVVVSGGAVVADVTAVVVDLSTTYTITPSVDAGSGTITPDTPQTVFAGGSVTFVITPDAGNMVGNVLVDGVSVGTPTAYEFTEVAADATIAVTFESPPSDVGGCAPSAGGTGFGLALLWLGMLVFLERRRETARV